ncbi:hypothetical protein COEREDRAFT_10479 [Coemansia reversa NRRL 1564]|uniref:Uncharacterized protein n=1 Tax=Coemansia reversa (strain ATCC 12441 / NRRL 1564) TaxID=763665 RepID=A0A2G5B5L1_COERN|nr:hypothetical protein COEREDRAFT_10479 [Coemansia reversa NRRL 1564]|eukprot:PIA14282.1 hypothetical protein COEREDRAFT_10479 [Coemansia reversa NRRL 1564]
MGSCISFPGQGRALHDSAVHSSSASCNVASSPDRLRTGKGRQAGKGGAGGRKLADGPVNKDASPAEEARKAALSRMEAEKKKHTPSGALKGFSQHTTPDHSGANMRWQVG